jgi:hypothetical protein
LSRRRGLNPQTHTSPGVAHAPPRDGSWIRTMLRTSGPGGQGTPERHTAVTSRWYPRFVRTARTPQESLPDFGELRPPRVRALLRQAPRSVSRKTPPAEADPGSPKIAERLLGWARIFRTGLVVAVGLASACSVLLSTVPVSVSGWYVSNAGTNSLTVYQLGANGDSPPLRTIAGSNTQLEVPVALALDASDHLYVASISKNRVTVYPAQASGNAGPLRVLEGPETLLSGPSGLALDKLGRLYVANAAPHGSPSILPAAAATPSPCGSSRGPRPC